MRIDCSLFVGHSAEFRTKIDSPIKGAITFVRTADAKLAKITETRKM